MRSRNRRRREATSRARIHARDGCGVFFSLDARSCANVIAGCALLTSVNLATSNPNNLRR
jgi:hypothetical protein